MGNSRFTNFNFLLFFILGLGLLFSGCQKEEVLEVNHPIFYKTISVANWSDIYDKNRNNDSYIILDVRTFDEYLQGHIEDAILIDFYSDNFKDKLNHIDKNKIYMIYCRTGHRSGETMKIMKELGFTRIYDLNGGVNSWLRIGNKLVI